MDLCSLFWSGNLSQSLLRLPSRHAPSPLIFKRMVGYAKQSYAILRNLVANPFVPKSKWKA